MFGEAFFPRDIQACGGKIKLDVPEYDIIVVPSDSALSGSGGMDKAVQEAAGPVTTDSLRKSAPVPKTMRAVLAPAGKLPCKALIFAIVPPRKGSELSDLVDCYRRCLYTVMWGKDLFGEAKSIAFPLLGTGSLGWSKEESIQAGWDAVLNFVTNPAEGLSSPWEGLLTNFTFCCGDWDGWMEYDRRHSRAFLTLPAQWGLRGDQYLWAYLAKHFDDPRYNRIDLRQFIGEVEAVIQEKCGRRLAPDMQVYVEEFAHGGMSSGYISGFWATRAIPLLCHSLCSLGLSQIPCRLMVPVTVAEGSGWSSQEGAMNLTLPYDILPDLQELLNRKE